MKVLIIVSVIVVAVVAVWACLKIASDYDDSVEKEGDDE